MTATLAILGWVPPIVGHPFMRNAFLAGTGIAAGCGSAMKEYEKLLAAGVDALFDDRDERPGVKFKDAELIGVPTIVVVGKGLAAGTVEIKDRASGDREDVPVAAAATRILEVVGG